VAVESPSQSTQRQQSRTRQAPRPAAAAAAVMGRQQKRLQPLRVVGSRAEAAAQPGCRLRCWCCQCSSPTSVFNELQYSPPPVLCPMPLHKKRSNACLPKPHGALPAAIPLPACTAAASTRNLLTTRPVFATCSALSCLPCPALPARLLCPALPTAFCSAHFLAALAGPRSAQRLPACLAYTPVHTASPSTACHPSSQALQF